MSDATKIRVHIRWMIRRDMPEVQHIEENSFDNPWKEEDFLQCLRQRNCIGMIAEVGEKVVGFMLYERHDGRLQLLNFATHPDYRRRGVGSEMIAKLLSKLTSHRHTKLVLEVRETNLTAQQFFRAVGFKADKVMRNYYDDTSEDAYRMVYEIPANVENDSLSVG